jgi:hypothetical protein
MEEQNYASQYSKLGQNKLRHRKGVIANQCVTVSQQTFSLCQTASLHSLEQWSIRCVFLAFTVLSQSLCASLRHCSLEQWLEQQYAVFFSRSRFCRRALCFEHTPTASPLHYIVSVTPNTGRIFRRIRPASPLFFLAWLGFPVL